MFVAAVVTLYAQAAFADSPIPADHSTVHLIFITPYEQSTAFGGFADETTEKVLIGDMVRANEPIRPVSITIDGEFSGHALPGFQLFSPTYVMPSGKHSFVFSCSGIKEVKADLQVVGSGSEQYLIVNLLPETPTPIEASTKTK